MNALSNPAVAAPPETLLNRPFLLVLMVAAVFGFSFSSFFLLPKFLSVALAADAVSIGSITTLFWLASALTVPYIGGLIDRHGRKRYALIGALILALSCIGFVWVDSLGPLIWLLRILQGIGFTLFLVALSTLAVDLAPPARLGQALGIFGAVMILTNAAGPAFAEWTSAHYGWQPVFVAAAAAALLAALLCRLLPEQRLLLADTRHATLWQVLRRPGIGPIILVSAMVGWVFGTLFTFYQPWALSLGIEQVASYFIAYAVVAVTIRIFFGDLPDRLGRLRVVRASLLLYVLTPLALVWLDQLNLYVAGAILGLTQGVYYPALNAVAIDCATPQERGKVMAAYSGAFNFGLAAAGLILGHLVLAMGYRSVFAFASVISLVAFALLAVTPQRHFRPAPMTPE